jgi:ElaB/YqjD/DUF883 family membrane-anchored ribosome-binding protein
MNNMDKPSSFVGDLSEAARQNPLSAALIGMGVLWLFTGNRVVESGEDLVRRRRFDRLPDAASDVFEAARSTVQSGADAIGERVTSAQQALRDGGASALDSAAGLGRDYADSASEYVSSLPAAGSEMLGSVRANLADIFKAQPLALGAVGIAIGAGIAAAFPSSNAETAYLGETSDAVKAKASEFASEQAARVKTKAEAVMETVNEEATRQGLTLEGAKSAAGDVSARVGRVADTAGKNLSERLTSIKRPS